MFTYIKSKVSVEEVAAKMSQQVELKIKVCQEMLQDSCDIAKIHEAAQSISKSKEKIHKDINYILKNSPEYYIQPLLLFAEYSLVLNYSPKECKKFFFGVRIVLRLDRPLPAVSEDISNGNFGDFWADFLHQRCCLQVLGGV